MEALRKPAPLSFKGNVAENWRTFESEFDIFVEAAYSDKNDRTRTYILLNLAGKDAIEKAKMFTYAAEVRNEDGDIIQAAESQESVAVLKAKFRELCNPLTNVIIERHKFSTRFQEASEPVQNFITALKILADTCEFGTLKDSLIRDRIVCWVSSDALRKQLLKERDLTLHKAVQLCQIHESAERYSKEVSDQQEVNAVRRLTGQLCHSPWESMHVLWTLTCTAEGTLPGIWQEVFFVHENASFRQSLQVNMATPREQKCQHCWPWWSWYASRGCWYSCHHTDKDPKWNSLHSESQHSWNQVENRHRGKMQHSTSWPFQESAEEGNSQQGESSQPGCIWRRKIFNSWHGWPSVQDWRHNTSAHISGPWQTSDSDFRPKRCIAAESCQAGQGCLWGGCWCRRCIPSAGCHRVCWFVWWPVGESCSQIHNESGQKRHSSHETSKKDSPSHGKEGQGRAGQHGEERRYCARDWTNRVGLTNGSHQKEERRRTDMSGSQRFEQSSQTTTSSHAYCRWCGLETGECEGLFNVGCEGWILADQAWKTILSPDAPAPHSRHQRSCWNPSHWARPGSQPSWRKSANSRNNTMTSQHDISGLWKPMKWYACRQTKASRDLQWWSQLETVPGHT